MLIVNQSLKKLENIRNTQTRSNTVNQKTNARPSSNMAHTEQVIGQNDCLLPSQIIHEIINQGK
jgi:hypothetical protein